MWLIKIFVNKELNIKSDQDTTCSCRIFVKFVPPISDNFEVNFAAFKHINT